MGIHYIITDENEDDFTEEQGIGKDFGCIFFATDDEMEGINLKYNGQHIEHIEHLRYRQNSAPFNLVRTDTYKFTPSNVVLQVSPSIVNINCNGLKIEQWMTGADGDAYTDHLNDFVASLIAIQANSYKENLQSVKKVGEARGLPHNVEGRIGTFLSGKTGPLISQENKLNQNMGISLAPRIKRKTRKAKGRKSA